jgi:hypothetical protein
VDINQDEWCGDFPLCVLAGLVVKVFIEFQNARAKGGPVVRGAERLYLIFRLKWHASPHGNLLAVLPGGAPQDWTWSGRFQNGGHESLRLARRQHQHGPVLNRPLRGGFGAVEDKIGHGTALQICRPLNEQLLFLV